MALESYTRTVWKSGDIVTATKFNNMENQISNLTKVFIPDNSADRMVASKSDWGLIKIANNDNFIFSNDGSLGFSATPNFTSVSTGSIAASGAITAQKVTLNASLNTYESLDLIPEGRMETYTSSTISDALSNRSISTGTGLTGGGTLAANRTISLSPATTDSLGGIRVGANLAISNGTLSGNYAVATTSTDGLLSATDKTKLDGLKTVATSGSYTDLTNRPTLATVATSGDYNDLNNTPTLAQVATTGNYAHLSNKPDVLIKPGETGAFYLSVYTEAGTDTLTSTWANLPIFPDLPTSDGTYSLQVVVVDGNPTYSWVNGGE